MTKANRVVQYRFVIFLVIAIIFNVIVIAVSIKSGIGRRDIMLRFNERQAVTFLSALMLGLTSLTSFIIYIIHVKAGFKKSDYLFWLVSAAGFLYLCLDEYFMMHEGLDEAVGYLFGKVIKSWNLDGLVIAFFGLIAFGVCWYFRKVIVRCRESFIFFILGGIGLAGTVFFHLVERIHIYLEVAEESVKLVGVSMFFCGFLIALFYLLDQLSISRISLKEAE